MGNPTSNSSFNYNQNGTNLSAGTYVYNFSTKQTLITLQTYINNSFTINKATPTLSITNSSNFIYNGNNGFFNVTITTINNQATRDIYGLIA